MPRGDDNVSIEVPAAATTPTPAVVIDEVASDLTFKDICWTEVVVLFVALEVIVCIVHA